MKKIKFGIVGTGNRGYTFARHIIAEGELYGLPEFQDMFSLVAMCDQNKIRLENVANSLKEKNIKIFTNYDQFLKESDCEIVIVTVSDFLHNEMCIKALLAGKNVLCEKPMTITVKDCQEIIQTAKKTKKQFRMGFNMRYFPLNLKIKELLDSGIIGNIISVQVNELMSAFHGADYFRRWHRNKEQSGGLLITKVVHLFDLMSWFIQSTSEKIVCFGSKDFFKPKSYEQTRCLFCNQQKECMFYFDLKHAKDGLLDKMFLQAEKEDGYIRDKCVFSKESDIEDNYTIMVTYKNNVKISYFLNFFCAAPSIDLSGNDRLMYFFVGDKGTLEVYSDEEDKEIAGIIEIREFLKGKTTLKIKSMKSSHGGGDVLLLKSFLNQENNLEQLTNDDLNAGLQSVLVGNAANLSLAENRIVYAKEFL
ncbi:MAG: Gfo/Idh/MocA family oxidoreductase [bacterium]